MRLGFKSPSIAALTAAICIQVVGCSGTQSISVKQDTPLQVEITQTPTPEASIPQTSSPESQSSSGAEEFYQKLLSQYGEDCTQCLEPIKVQLQDSSFSSKDKPPSSQSYNVLIALDSSGSMAESVAGGKKMAIAKTAVSQFASKLPSTANVGLLVYGHKGSNQKADRGVSCAGIETIYPISPLDRTKFTNAVNSVQPTGYTPLAAALEKSEQALNTSTTENAQNVIFVVSDGIETCNGDPVSVARRLHNSKTKVIVNVIGFDVDNQAQRQLQAVADAGGGKYFSARSAADLNQIFDRSRTLSELNKYRVTNLQNQNRVTAVLTQASNQLTACILQKQNREQANILMALNRLSANDPNNQYRTYVLSRQTDRQQKITAWRQRLNEDIANRRDLTIDRLERDLQQVTSSVQNNL